MNQRLLERIRNLDAGDQELVSDDTASEIRSILEHLQCLLNTRQGTVLIDDAYGMPDIFFTQGTSFHDNSQSMVQLLTETIRKYEPRLKNVTVRIKPRMNEVLEQHFTVQATLARDETAQFEFSAVVSSEGKIRTSE